MVMIGKKVKLLSPEPEDIDFIYHLENNPEIWHLGDNYFPFSKFDIENYVISTPKDIYKLNQLRLIIKKLSDDTAIGTIDLFNFQPVSRRVAAGIIIAAGERGRGYAADALQVVIDYCFAKLNLHQIYAGILENNLPSIKLFESCGFRHTGTQCDWVLSDGEWFDLLFYQLFNPHTTI
jgi:diamine N-acetyltransferase